MTAFAGVLKSFGPWPEIPTMKPLDLPKKEEKADCSGIAPLPLVEEKIGFSKVEIELLFSDQVGFETFTKSDFRAVKSWPARR